jgi:replicative DNA helicase
MTDSAVQALKVPPHSVEAEQSVLGGLLLDNSAWDRVGDVITEKDFYRPDHGLIYRVIGKLVGESMPADVITVSEAMKTQGGGDAVGIDYLNALAQSTPSASNIRGYAEIVRDRSVLRRLIQTSDTIAGAAFTPEGRSVQTILDEAESRILAIGEEGSRGKTDFLEIAPLLTEVVKRIDELYRRQGGSDVTGVSTGFIDLDRQTSGLQKGDLIVVAGRPSMGKAQPLDAQIKTNSGWKAMGDLQVGDRLASFDGQPSLVTGIYPQGFKQIFKVTLSDGRETECCAEHLWRVMYRDWSEPRVINTSRLIEMLSCTRYKNRLWVDNVSGDFGHDRELPIHPWVLGALLGDGTLALSHSSVMFSTKSPEMVERMNALMGYQMELVHAQAYDWRVVSKDRITANGTRTVVPNAFRGTLNDLGLLGARSYDKYIPAEYLEANKRARLALLQGLLDTDGWIEKWGSVRFCTVSPRLAQDVATLARSLGAFCSIATKATSYVSNGERKQGQLAYVLNMSFEADLEVFTLPEKKERLRSTWDRQRRLTFKRIEPSRIAQAQCISVSHPTKTYVTDNYVVTHNTAFSVNIAENVALKEGLPVLVFSMEMGASQLASRILGSVGRIDQSRMRTGKLADDEWPKITEAISRLNETTIMIDETGALSSLELRARARRIARKCGALGLIVVDYLQLMSGNGGGSSENRATEISEISRSLKSLAKELQCPVIALSQLNRGLEQRPNKRPVMSDLRESGAIEQDADVILFIYRDEVYHPETTPDKGVAEIICAKQRNGPIGTVKLSWQGQFTKFDNLAATPGQSSGGYEPF